jgi:hypothetical protein
LCIFISHLLSFTFSSNKWSSIEREREREREREDTWRDWIGEERRGSSSNASEESSKQTSVSIKEIDVSPNVFARWVALSFHGFLFEPKWGFQGFRFGFREREKGFFFEIICQFGAASKMIYTKNDITLKRQVCC